MQGLKEFLGNFRFSRLHDSIWKTKASASCLACSRARSPDFQRFGSTEVQYLSIVSRASKQVIKGTLPNSREVVKLRTLLIAISIVIVFGCSSLWTDEELTETIIQLIQNEPDRPVSEFMSQKWV